MAIAIAIALAMALGGTARAETGPMEIGTPTPLITGVVCRNEALLRQVHAAMDRAAREPRPVLVDDVPAGCLLVLGVFTPRSQPAGLDEVRLMTPSLDANGPHRCAFRDREGIQRQARCVLRRMPVRFFRGSVVVEGSSFADVHFHLGVPNLAEQYARQPR